ncbi:hypothetical protein CLV63_114157 [Murinocardiopsis flavida]|uniref:ATPase AAA-type core domain-containing protein n=1 Tax=Murinocardiopsis flavida TaxID=645275 RepID=A0A2P8DER8_9ACTN|nr:ATP-binding protein [Murinocardiopsis flavida]PSK95724.1 hypothetical protein CLV63_114157 [Murinocardiopsis flavida]
MLLRFRVANHRSIREEQELSLVAVPRQGEAKPKASEIPRTVRVAGIYGANASGKSNVLDALRWMQWALRGSFTSWSPDGGVPRTCFTLDEESRKAPSFYEADLVDRGVRYSYGFEVTDQEVMGEWLFAFPKGRPQRMFERSKHEQEEDYRFGRSLTGELQQIRRLTRPNALFLSTAASNNHKRLSRLYRAMTQHLKAATQNSVEEQSRTRFTTSLLAEEETADQVNRLVRIADLGISRVRMEKKPVDEELLARLTRSFEPEGFPKEFFQTMRDDLSTTLIFTHACAGQPGELSIDEESDGTRSWISLVGPLIQVLRQGDVFLVDEIDSSLHPMISSTMIKMFKDPDINPRGAQLIFASHDTTLLGTMLENKLLDRDEVWFTEKDAHGATSLFSLAEFRPRGTENAERGYLQGRYGAVPFVDFSEIRSLFRAIHGVADESAETVEEEPAPVIAGP